jgi:hypothetical protein
MDFIEDLSANLLALDLNKNTEKEIITIEENISKKTHKVITEDVGKMFEMAICLALNIPFNGKYKYGMELPNKLKTRLQLLNQYYNSNNTKHTAQSQSRYDFTTVEGETIKYLSAKSSKSTTCKVAPQVIGQTKPDNFCKILNILYVNNPELKKYIQENVTLLLPQLFNYTFDCPNIYYNKKRDTIKYIIPDASKVIDWTNYEYKWTKNFIDWNNSSTLKIYIDKKWYSIMEFQFHSSSRSNMAIRWHYDIVIALFKSYFTIIDY